VLSPVRAVNVGTILVVEDEDLVREMITEELQASGYAVLKASCADEALAVLHREAIAILFTDIRMPGRLDGWALAEEAHRRNPAIKVIYTTGYSQERPRLVPHSLYIPEPYRASEILAAVERLSGEG
jgi:CheY-like chemotaxis protein